MLLAGALVSCATPVATVPRSVTLASSSCKQPPYPEAARRDEASGTTELEIEVNADGKVTRVAIARSAGPTPSHKLLDTLALESLAKCSFAPAPGFLSGTGRLSFVWRLND